MINLKTRKLVAASRPGQYRLDHRLMLWTPCLLIVIAMYKKCIENLNTKVSKSSGKNFGT